MNLSCRTARARMRSSPTCLALASSSGPGSVLSRLIPAASALREHRLRDGIRIRLEARDHLAADRFTEEPFDVAQECVLVNADE